MTARMTLGLDNTYDPSCEISWHVGKGGLRPPGHRRNA